MRVVAIGGLLAFGLLLVGCEQRLPTLRYRLTVEIQTPFGTRTGSSVIEVTTVDQGKGFPGPEAGGVRRDAIGQAVIIEVAPQHYIFALLGKKFNYDYAAGLPIGVLRPLIGSGRHPVGPNQDRVQDYLSYDQFHRRMIADRNIWEVPRTKPANSGDGHRDYWPDIVRFGDINNPETVEWVESDTATIKRVTLQIVDEPVTEGIRSILPWLGRYPEPSLNPKHGPYDHTASAVITQGDFIRKMD